MEQLSYSKFFNCNTNFREKSSQTSISHSTLSLPSPLSRCSREELAGRVADVACRPAARQAEDADRPPTIRAVPCLVTTATRTPCRAPRSLAARVLATTGAEQRLLPVPAPAVPPCTPSTRTAALHIPSLLSFSFPGRAELAAPRNATAVLAISAAAPALSEHPPPPLLDPNRLAHKLPLTSLVLPGPAAAAHCRCRHPERPPPAMAAAFT